MKNEPLFSWDQATHTAACLLTDGEHYYSGIAQCHPDDFDMESEKTGCEIAFRRAKIEALKSYRDELKIKLKTLQQLYYSMNMSNKFNENSYENKMLQRQIHILKFDLDTTKEILVSEKQNLKEYIKEKDNFYNTIRSKRNKVKGS